MSSLFQKSSIESGPGVRMTAPEDALRTTHWVLDRLGLLPCQAHPLLEVPAATLLDIQSSPPPNDSLSTSGGRHGIGAFCLGGFSPVVDGQVLPAHSFDPGAPAISADKPLMVGWNHDEVVFFYWQSKDRSVFDLDEPGLLKHLTDRFGDRALPLLQAYHRSHPDLLPSQIAVAIESAGFSGAGSTAIAERNAMLGGAPVFLYTLTDHINATVPDTNYQMGAMHAMDIRLKFDNIAIAEGRLPSLTPQERADHEQVARNMSRMWANFARHTRPSAPDQPDWPAHDIKDRSTMMIASRCHVAQDPYPLEQQVWSEGKT